MRGSFARVGIGQRCRLSLGSIEQSRVFRSPLKAVMLNGLHRFVYLASTTLAGSRQRHRKAVAETTWQSSERTANLIW